MRNHASHPTGWMFLAMAVLGAFASPTAVNAAERRTVVSIEGRAFFINGKPTYPGRNYNGIKVEGLLLNSRMVQGIFDDLNPDTRGRWKYPDGPWDPERNVREFVAAMPQWRAHGLTAITINLQGGSPQGYSKDQPWINSAFNFPDGSLRPDYMKRLEKILDKADELGMAVIVSYFYFGQSPRFKDESAVIAAADNATDWILDKGYTNVLVEIANECNVKHTHEIIRPGRAHELIERVQAKSRGKVKSPAKRLLASTSYGGGAIPGAKVAKAADFLLLHGNGVGDPAKIAEMVRKTRAQDGYHHQPVLFNEDDHFRFDEPKNNMLAAISEYAGWGYFDYRLKGEGFNEGYQSVPVDWGVSSDRKRGFFNLLARVTGSEDVEAKPAKKSDE